MAESALTGGELGAALQFRSQVAGPGPELRWAASRSRWPRRSTTRTISAWTATATRAATSSPSRRPRINEDVNNNQTSATAITATVVDATQLTSSDYKVDFDGTNFNVYRLSDNKKTVISPFPQSPAAGHRRPRVRRLGRGRYRRQLPRAPDPERRRQLQAGADGRCADRGRRADRDERPADQRGSARSARVGRQELPGRAAGGVRLDGVRQGIGHAGRLSGRRRHDGERHDDDVPGRHQPAVPGRRELYGRRG